ncbi:MAG: hypothetical protein IPF78_17655 [Flavobacteriales bacterium]|nr:hypothetical protein [Flavobacteriales bacterium]
MVLSHGTRDHREATAPQSTVGLRGQAKTRMARCGLVQLLDEWMPVVEKAAKLNDDTLRAGVALREGPLVAAKGDATQLWIHRDERYTEKLAPPDVTVADVIGDSDPIKAANLQLDYSDERGTSASCPP